MTDALLGDKAPTIPTINMEHFSKSYVQKNGQWVEAEQSYQSLEVDIENN
jgi:hypothetical protein